MPAFRISGAQSHTSKSPGLREYQLFARTDFEGQGGWIPYLGCIHVRQRLQLAQSLLSPRQQQGRLLSCRVSELLGISVPKLSPSRNTQELLTPTVHACNAKLAFAIARPSYSRCTRTSVCSIRTAMRYLVKPSQPQLTIPNFLPRAHATLVKACAIKRERYINIYNTHTCLSMVGMVGRN